MDFDMLLNRVGGMGWYQMKQYAVLCSSVLPIGMQTLANSFIADTVDTTCITFQLYCDRAHLANLSQSIFMLGFLVGAFGLGMAADKYGRKMIWYITILCSVVTGVLAGITEVFYLHVFFRAMTAVSSAGSYTVGFVLALEIIGKQRRLAFGLLFHAFFALGYMCLAGLAYFIRYWRVLQVVISMYGIIFIPAFYFINESPRWYLTQGRHSDVKKILKIIAQSNGKIVSDEEIDKDLGSLEKASDQKIKDSAIEKKTVLDLFKTPKLRLITINIFFNWFVNSLVYYGLSHGISKLSGDTYLNMAIAGILEITALVLSIFALQRIGRRWPITILLISAGVACLICAMIPIEHGITRMIFSTIGRFLIAASFSIIYIFSAEVFPTVVRISGVGAGSMHARIGGFIAPLVADLGSNIFNSFPMVLFGTLSVLAGSFALYLPETLNKHLPETLEDAENFNRKDSSFKKSESDQLNLQDKEIEC